MKIITKQHTLLQNSKLFQNNGAETSVEDILPSKENRKSKICKII